MKTINFVGMGYSVKLDEDLFESLHGEEYGRVSIDDGKSWMTLEETFKAFMKELVKVAKDKSKVLEDALKRGKVKFVYDSGVRNAYSYQPCKVTSVKKGGQLDERSWMPLINMRWNKDDGGNITIASNYLPCPLGKISDVFANWVKSISE